MTTSSNPEPNRQQLNRQQLVAKMHKALRAHYKPVEPDVGQPMLEQVLFACCLENAPYEIAAQALKRLRESYFDLNEVRVTTVAELAETLQGLPDPAKAALSLRRVLQSVFESSYSFSLDNAKKHSIAHGIKTLEHLHGIPPFVVAYVGSTALGGHFVPLDLGAMQALFLTGIISAEEYDAGKQPGLDRYVPKKAGVEFGSLLHQFGVEVLTNVHGAAVKKLLQAINPAAKDRFPKRGEALPAPNPPPVSPGKDSQRAADAAEAARTAAEEHRPAGPQAAARPAGRTPLPPPGSGPKRAADGKPIAGSKPGPKPFVVKPNVGRAPAANQPPEVPPQAPAAGKGEPVKKAAVPAKKPPVAKKLADKPAKPAPASKPKAKESAAKNDRTPASKKASNQHSDQLSRRKPR